MKKLIASIIATQLISEPVTIVIWSDSCRGASHACCDRRPTSQEGRDSWCHPKFLLVMVLPSGSLPPRNFLLQQA
jgi:hypothetical protein